MHALTDSLDAVAGGSIRPTGSQDDVPPADVAPVSPPRLLQLNG